MFNSSSYSSANANANASINSMINNHNENNSYTPIIRINNDSKFKKIKINSYDFDLITCDNPCLFKKYEEIKEIYDNVEYIFYYQEIKVLSFNQISSKEMIIEYVLINDLKKDTIIIKKENEKIFDFNTGYERYIFVKPKHNEIILKIFKKLLTNNL